MNEQPQKERGKKEGRSPGYPAINLETALDRARLVMDKEKKHYAAQATLFGHWGYGPKSSMGMLVLAALKKYGLIEYKGAGDSREAKLTDLAWRILVDDRPISDERMALVREAALNPAIHQKLWHDYDGQLPSDENLRHRLLTVEGFTTGAVDDFIREFRETITFAKLEEPDSLLGHEEDKKSPESEGQMSPIPQNAARDERVMPPVTASSPPAQSTATGTIQFPLSAKKWVKLELPYQLSEEEWQRIINALAVFKPGFITENKEKNEQKDP